MSYSTSKEDFIKILQDNHQKIIREFELKYIFFENFINNVNSLITDSFNIPQRTINSRIIFRINVIAPVNFLTPYFVERMNNFYIFKDWLQRNSILNKLIRFFPNIDFRFYLDSDYLGFINYFVFYKK